MIREARNARGIHVETGALDLFLAILFLVSASHRRLNFVRPRICQTQSPPSSPKTWQRIGTQKSSGSPCTGVESLLRSCATPEKAHLLSHLVSHELDWSPPCFIQGDICRQVSDGEICCEFACLTILLTRITASG